MVKTKIINLIGGPSAGKSTLAALIFAELKIRGRQVELVQEFAKTLVWQNKFEQLKDNLFVYSTQYRLLRDIADTNQVEYIVTDGPLIHGVCYNRKITNDVYTQASAEEILIQYHRSFENINIFVQRGDFKYERIGRYQTEAEARDMDRDILQVLDVYKIDYIYWTNERQSVSDLVDSIIS